MEPDVMLVTGMGLLVLSLPSIVSAWADNRAPRVGALVLLAGGGLVVWAFREKPGGYRPADIPDVIYSVIGQMLP
ncbi:hypothetical protein [Mameliella sediminis]|uniref:hypothetical protein n=1 Tax=Mameliella sediminis TaxID=2836866 RepID=UPI001C439FE5|nr:hypothetical protein [Mameliella sediminis]MBV7394340.1 hypothetical protein [Mameliella sediminis]